jgi:hypothetical protein
MLCNCVSGVPMEGAAIKRDADGRPEIHYTRIYSAWRRWVANGCMAAIFVASVLKLHQDGLLDTTVIHGDGRTTAAITSASVATIR